MSDCVLNRAHAPGRAARGPYYPTHRVRAWRTHSVRAVSQGCMGLTERTERRSNVQKFAGWERLAGTASGARRIKQATRRTACRSE